jgi:PPE-repeat protein
MDFAALPPEINSGLMYTGPGSGPMIAAAASWDGLAAEVSAAASNYRSLISNLTSGPWRGPASASMAAAAAPYVAWTGMAATQAGQTASQAKAAAGAYETAFAMTVPPPVIAANRALLMSLIATNFLGQNAPAIAATEAHYAEMWAQDAAAMYGYAGSSAAASALTPFTEPPPTTTTAGPAMQAAAVAQATGTATPTTLSQLTSAIPQALHGLASPGPSGSSSASASSGILGLLTGSGSGSSELDNLWNEWGPNANIWNTIFSSGFYMPGNWIGTLSEIPGLLGTEAAAAEGAAGAAAAEGLGGALAAPLGGLGGLGGVAAGLGQAGSIGALSVPPSWTAPIGAAASALPGASLGAAPQVGAGGPGSLLGGLPLAGPAGHGMNGAAPRYGFRPTVIAHPPSAG